MRGARRGSLPPERGTARVGRRCRSPVLAVDHDRPECDFVAGRSSDARRGSRDDTCEDQYARRGTTVLRDDREPVRTLTIVGHDESRGSVERSLALSVDRARSVSDFISTAYPAVPTRVLGRGESEPVASNATPMGRQLNRRVEIQVVARSSTEPFRTAGVTSGSSRSPRSVASAPRVSEDRSPSSGPQQPDIFLETLSTWSEWIPVESVPPVPDAEAIERVAAILRNAAAECEAPLNVELLGVVDGARERDDDPSHWLRAGEVDERLRAFLPGSDVDIVAVAPSQIMVSLTSRPLPPTCDVPAVRVLLTAPMAYTCFTSAAIRAGEAPSKRVPGNRSGSRRTYLTFPTSPGGSAACSEPPRPCSVAFWPRLPSRRHRRVSRRSTWPWTGYGTT